MNNIKKVLLGALTIFVALSCEDESLAPIVTFDSAGHGAYIRLVTDSETGSTLMNVLTQSDFDASSYGYSVEFVDDNKGRNVSEYVLSLEYDDNDASNGDNSQTVELRRFNSSSFAENADGFQGVTGITISSADLTSALGIAYADISSGDNFFVRGSLIMNDGRTFASTNSSSTVRGGAFRAIFDITLPAACPSDLAGTVDYTTTNAWCDGTGTTGTVDIIAMGGGTYVFSDWSFGAYSICYSPTSVADSEGITFTETCAEIAFTGFTDDFGDTWTFTSSITGNDWTIGWTNTYGESATSVVHWPTTIPFSLAP